MECAPYKILRDDTGTTLSNYVQKQKKNAMLQLLEGYLVSVTTT